MGNVAIVAKGFVCKHNASHKDVTVSMEQCFLLHKPSNAQWSHTTVSRWLLSLVHALLHSCLTLDL